MTGQEFKEKIEALEGWTKAAIAKKLGKNRQQFNSLFLNKKMKPSVIKEVATALDISMSYFTGEEDITESQAKEPALQYAASIVIDAKNFDVVTLQAKLITVYDRYMHVAEDNIKDKAVIIELQDEKIKQLVNDHSMTKKHK